MDCVTDSSLPPRHDHFTLSFFVCANPHRATVAQFPAQRWRERGPARRETAPAPRRMSTRDSWPGRTRAASHRWCVLCRCYLACVRGWCVVNARPQAFSRHALLAARLRRRKLACNNKHAQAHTELQLKLDVPLEELLLGGNANPSPEHLARSRDVLSAHL